MALTVREYLTADGKNPFANGSLTKAVRARIQLRLQRFELGNLGDHKNVARASGRLAFWRRSAMARRSRDWNIGLAEDLRDREFGREFLLGAIDEGVPLQVALAKVVRAMGVKEFAAKVGMASPNLLRTLNPRHNPTQDTLNRLLKPFRLKLSLAPISDRPKRRNAA